LIGDLGELLHRTVKVPMIRRLVRWMRGPAHAAGFGKLQGFLDDGLSAFAEMGDDATQFVSTITRRETRALGLIEQGSEWPFREWIGQGPQR